MTPVQPEQFDWIKIKEEIGSTNVDETQFDKFKRKFGENPFVPIGATLTTAALLYGLYSMKRGERRMSQMMMRARILAQGLTVAALCGGVAIQAFKDAEPKAP